MTTHTPTATPIGRGESAVADAVAEALTDLGIPVEPPRRTWTTPDLAGDWKGGVHITPAEDGSGLIIAWRLTESLHVDPHEFARCSVIVECLNTALGHVLTVLGWNVHPWDDGASHLLAGRRPLAALRTYPASPA